MVVEKFCMRQNEFEFAKPIHLQQYIDVQTGMVLTVFAIGFRVIYRQFSA